MENILTSFENAFEVVSERREVSEIKLDPPDMYSTLNHWTEPSDKEIKKLRKDRKL